MARLKVSNGQPVSLFPMFNILVCTLGCLILIVGTVTAFSLGPGRTISINVGGSNKESHHKMPTYIEWDGKAIVIHPERNRIPLLEINLSDKELKDLSANTSSTEAFISAAKRRQHSKIMTQVERTPFEDLLQRIHRKRDSEYLVIMIRPSGFDTLVSLRNFILEKGVDVGYEPIEQNWNLRVK